MGRMQSCSKEQWDPRLHVPLQLLAGPRLAWREDSAGCCLWRSWQDCCLPGRSLWEGVLPGGLRLAKAGRGGVRWPVGPTPYMKVALRTTARGGKVVKLSGRGAQGSGRYFKWLWSEDRDVASEPQLGIKLSLFLGQGRMVPMTASPLQSTKERRTSSEGGGQSCLPPSEHPWGRGRGWCDHPSASIPDMLRESVAFPAGPRSPADALGTAANPFAS